MAACKQPGVSTSAVALANGLNANLLRRWISESKARPPKPTALAVAAKQAKTLSVATQAQFVPVQLQANGAAPVNNIQIELQRGATLVRVQWPIAGAAQCAAWIQEVLK